MESEWRYISSGLQDSSQYDLNIVVCMVSIFPTIFNSPSFLYKLLGTVPSAPTTIGTTVTFMFHSFLALWQDPLLLLLLL